MSDRIPLEKILSEMEHDHEVVRFRIAAITRAGLPIGYFDSTGQLVKDENKAEMFSIPRAMSEMDRNVKVKHLVRKYHRLLEQELQMTKENSVRHIPFRTVTVKAIYL